MELISLGMLVSVTLLVPATVLVFTVGRSTASPARLPRVIAATLATGAAAAGVAALIGADRGQALIIGLGTGATVLAWSPIARHWATRGLVAWTLTLNTGALYLAYVLSWTLSADLPILSLVAGLALWVLELFVFFIGVGYVWEFIDVVARRHWPRQVEPRDLSDEQRRHRPFVSLHVPTHNEPPEMVIATLTQLLELEYDDYEVLLVDNNTTDPALWRPVEDFCALHERLKFIHLEDWPGFKSGALNYALTQVDPRTEVIGIVDADYLVDPTFLADCAPLFADPDVAFVQTPQDYRDWEQASYFRRLYYSYSYFFDVSQRSRNERNAAIFGGTMGLIRRSALTAVGNWDEWCITEDAELSLRLLREGDRGVHVERAYGQGVMPLTFEALKRQRFRWCFGGIQILRMHWRSLLPGRVKAGNQLTPAQRWGYFVGGLQWFGDLAAILFTGFLLIGAADLVLGTGVVARRLAGFMLLAVVVLVVLGIVRALALVRRTSGASWTDAIGAFGLWLALGLTVARASARGLVARQGVFLRTPKVKGELSARHALIGNIGETALAVICAVAAVVVALQGQTAGAVLAVLLGIQASGFAAAPLNSLAAIRADLPADLERRRRFGLASWEGPVRRGGLAIALGAAVVAVLVVSASPIGVPIVEPGVGVLPGTKLDRTPRPAAESPTPAPTPGSDGTTVLVMSPGAEPSARTRTRPSAAPTRPGQPTKPATPTQAATPTQQPKPTQAATPTQQPKPTQAARPTAKPKPTQATSPTRKPKPTRANEPTNRPATS